ncbi:MAG: hypothetical protein IPO63_16360 [Bacteroidetes bacterium]|nr:hypothetical protein [Bacteroidota bacterium]
MGGGYLLSINAASAISLTINGQTFSSAIVQTPGLPSSSIFDGQCHHIAVKRASNILSFFYDGNFISSQAISSNLSMSSNNYLRVGCDQLLSSTSAFKGSMDYLRIWNIAVRDHDIFNNQQRCLSSPSGLVANWSFEQTPDEVILDATHYSHHGLIIPSHGTPVNTGPRFNISNCASENCDYIVLEPAHDDLLCTTSPTPSYCSQLNMICNGDFEQENAPAGSPSGDPFGSCTAAGSSNEVINWCKVGGNPGYFSTTTGNVNFSIPLNNVIPLIAPNCQGGINTWNGTANGNNHYAVLGYLSGDGIRSELISPLTPNKNYTLRFRALRVNNNAQAPLIPTPLKFELWDDASGTNGLGIGSVDIAFAQNCNWNLYTLTFTAPSTPTNLDQLVVKVEGITAPGVDYFFFVDDFEIYEETSDYPRWMSGTGSQRPSEIVTDAANNVYFAGFANQEITYPNNVVQGIPNEVTGFIASYDECGSVRWSNNSIFTNIRYKSVAFNNINVPNQLLVASETSTGINIEIYDPANGNLISTTPVPGTTSDHTIITSKTDVNGQNWYILLRDDVTNLFYFAQYGIITTTISLSLSIPNTLQEISDFSINSFLTGNANKVFLTANINATSAIIDYDIQLNTFNSYTISTANGNSSEVLKLTSLEQNNAGILCVGGFYSNCDVSYNGTTIVPNVQTTAIGIIHNTAFTFLFNPTIPIPNVVATSGRYIGGDGASRTTKIIVNPAGDFIAAGMMSSSFVALTTNTNFNSAWTPNPNPGGLFYTKLNSITGDDQWLKQGITSNLGTWQRDLVCGSNGTIYGIGYLNGTIDFLQGDTWNSTTQCDNTYVLKIIDSGNNAVVDRHASPFISTSSSPENTKGYMLKNEIEFNELLRNNSILDYYIIDFSGRIINSSNTNITTNGWNQLAQGCYYLKEYNSSNSRTIFICK